MSYDTRRKCNQKACNKKTKTDKFNAIRAREAGWFFQKDGSIWCPDHVPDWVASWREKNDKQ
jgi:hypothetical protein